MSFKKLGTLILMSFLAFFLTACSKEPDASFKNTLDLGFYDGMHITWIKDDANTSGVGFYLIDDSNIDQSKSNNQAFDNEKLVGHYGNLNIFWVRDHSEARSRGFYLFRNEDNKLITSSTFNHLVQSGKSQSVVSVYSSSIKNPIMQIKLNGSSNEEVIQVDNLSSSELRNLSQRLIELANQKGSSNPSN